MIIIYLCLLILFSQIVALEAHRVGDNEIFNLYINTTLICSLIISIITTLTLIGVSV